MDIDTGRINQKLRTRKSIMVAAHKLMQTNPKPSVDEIAKEALVSRATIYRYFADVDNLLREAALEMNVFGEGNNFEPKGNDFTEKLLNVHAFGHAAFASKELSFRQYYKAFMDRMLETGGKEKNMRSGRRIVMIEKALEDVKPQMKPAEYRSFVYMLCLLIGFESFFVLRDVCDCTPQESKKVVDWAIKTLINGMEITE